MPLDAAGGARPMVSLDGIWDFVHADDGLARRATVPLPWQAQFADLRQRGGRAVYSRSFDAPLAAGLRACLCFGAVSDRAEVHLNGTLLGVHEGGYLPFEFDVTDLLRPTGNTLSVAAHLPEAGDGFAEIPHGKQSWYGPIAGIWQSVRLEFRPAAHVTACAITADMHGQIDVVLRGTAAAPLALRVLDPDGRVVAEHAGQAVQPETALRLQVPGPRLWSPETPALYAIEVTLGEDRTRHSFGFRSFEARGGRFFLNGAPWFMRAALDQDYYPEGIATPPSTAYLEDQLHKAKALGLNMLRCHIKVPDPRYYEVADRLGMLIWTEIPNVASFTEASSARLLQTMEGILARDGNHPSIVIWTLINEDWGTRLCEDASHRQWLKDSYDWLKARDPSRLVVDNSPCHGNFHVKSDIDDFHYYRSVPERREEWDRLTEEFAGRAAWTYSPFGDAERRGDEPLVVSEFGVWGLPDPEEVQIDGAEPWWMDTGATWGDGAAYPRGVQGRFAASRLDTVFGTFRGFVEAVQWYQFRNLKYQIEVMRDWPTIQGYVITEFTDVHWESNGLLDMNRNPRVFHDRFGTINADVVIVPRIGHHAVVAGQVLEIDLGVATGGAALKGAVLHWQSAEGQGGEIALPDTGPLSRAEAGRLAVPVAAEGGPRMLGVDFRVVQGGAELARNSAEVAVYPPRAAAAGAVARPAVATPDAALAARLVALGYSVVAPDAAAVTVVHALDGADIARLQAGARYVVLADGSLKTHGNLRIDPPGREQPFIPVVDETPGIPKGSESLLPNINLIARHGTMWRGDWIAGFSWLRRAGHFAAIPGGPLVDLSFDRVVPHHVMTGFRGWEYGACVHAGLVVGWANKPAALIAERRVGRGGVLASTFRLCGDAPGADPVASALMDALIAQAAAMPVDA